MTRRLAILVGTLAVAASAQQQMFGPCMGPEAYRVPDGRDYRGFVNVTVSGYTCQMWTSQTPQQHDTIIDPALGLGPHNYCRNPFVRDGLRAPGCFTTNPNVRFEACSVGDACDPSNAPVTAAPVFTPDVTLQIAPFTFTITSITNGAVVFYTLDGTVPTASSPIAAGPITISSSGVLTVTTYAWKSGWQPSGVITKQYAISPPQLMPVAISPVAAPVGSAFPQPVLVTLASSDVGASVFYTTDGSVPDETSTPYIGPFWVKQSCRVMAVAVRVGSQSSPPSAVDYVLSVPQMPAPTVSPMGGVFFGSVVFALYTPVAFGSFTVSANASIPQAVSGGSSTTLSWTSPGTYVLTFVTSCDTMADSAPFSILVTVLPIPTPQLSVPGGIFYQATTISVLVDSSYVDPVTGQRVNGAVSTVLTVNGVRQVGSTVTLNKIGVFDVRTFTRTRFGDSPQVAATFDMRSTPLAAPQLSPDPFNLDPNFLFSSPLYAALLANPAANFIVSTRSSDSMFASDPAFLSGLADNTLPLYVTRSDIVTYYLDIIAISAWNDPFAANSSVTTRAFRIAPQGTASSPTFRYTSTAPLAAGAATNFIRRAFFLPDASLDAANYVYVVYETPYIVFRFQNILQDVATSLTGYFLSQAQNASSALMTTMQAVDGRTLSNYFTTKCFSRAIDMSALGLVKSSTIAALTPSACAVTCADTNALFFALTGSSSCYCTRVQPAAALSLDWAQCATPCRGDSSQTCGSTVAFQFFALISTVPLFALPQSWTIRGTVGQSMQATTTTPFDLAVSIVNAPATGGYVKFLPDDRSCNALAPVATFDVTGVAYAVVVRTAAARLYLCVAFADDATNFYSVPHIVGRTLAVVATRDITASISPAGGTFVGSVTAQMTTADGVALEVSVDRQTAVRRPTTNTSVVVNALGVHVVTVVAVNSQGNKGAPVSAVYTIVAVPPPQVARSTVTGYIYAPSSAVAGTVQLILVGSFVSSAGASRFVRITTSPLLCAQSAATFLSTGTSTMTGNATLMSSDASFSLGNARMDRSALTVCFGERLATDDPNAPTTFFAAVPLDGKLSSLLGYPAPASGWTLSVAAANIGRCAPTFSTMCANGGACSATVFQSETQMACVCPSAFTLKTANATIACTVPVTSADVALLYWNGTGTLPITGAGTGGGGGGPGTAPRTAPQGSITTLIVLNLFFVASLALLFFIKKQSANKADDKAALPAAQPAASAAAKVAATKS